jgi:hypothetical protein
MAVAGLLTGLLVMLLSVQALAAPQKLALIIALANYPPENNWAKISSDNDIVLIKEALVMQGFEPQNMTVLVDGQGTKAGIVTAFQALIQKASKGDIVIVHFSSHGQQIWDDNGDELDGYDEAIVPYDAGVYFETGVYEGERHLRDDELGALVDALREKVGPEGNVLLILDSCHSGTGTRGLRQYRGTEIKFQPEGYKPTVREGRDAGFLEDQAKRGEGTEKAPMVLLSGASQDEVNYEYYDYYSGFNYGSLSYAFSKYFSSATNSTTYRTLFDKIQVEMSNIASNQTPQIEGDIDRGILGGQAVEQKNFYKARSWFNENTIILGAGNLVGLFNNTTVALYPSGTADPSKATPISTGTITWSNMMESDVTLDQPIDETTALDAWIFVEKQNFGDMRTRIKLSPLSNKGLNDALYSRLSALATVQLVDEHPDLLIEPFEPSRGTGLHVITTDEYLVYSTELTGSSMEQEVTNIVEKVKEYTQANLLRKVDMYDPYIEIRFILIPITVKQVGTKYVEDQRFEPETKLGYSGNFEFRNGDCFKIMVGNFGSEPAYYQILDIQPDNTIGMLIPSENRTAAEYKLYPGETIELDDIFIFGEPYGTEIFKLIASDEILNLKGIVSTRGNIGEENPSPFELLFSDTYEQTRASTLSIKPNSASMYTIPVAVTP